MGTKGSNHFIIFKGLASNLTKMKQKVETSKHCSARIAIGAMRSVWNLPKKKGSGWKWRVQ